MNIEFTKVTREQYMDTMITQFASGSPPDIAHLAVFEVGPIAARGWLEDLTPYLEKSELPMEDWAGRDKCRWEGKEVCVLLSYFGSMLAYNQAMFDEAGLELPENYEEFLEAARTLTKDTNDDGITDQFGVGHHTIAGGAQYLTEMLPYILDAGARWTDPKSGKPTFDTPEMVEGLTRWKTVLDEKLTPLDIASGEIRQLFTDGKIAMRVDGPWMYGIMKGASPETAPNLQVAAPPFHPPLGGSSHALAIPTEISDERKQLVWEFIELVGSEKWQKEFVTITGAPAPRPNSVPENVEESVPHFDIILETMAEASKAGVDRVPTGFETTFNEFSKIVEDETIRMMIEDGDPAATTKAIQEKLEALQAR